MEKPCQTCGIVFPKPYTCSAKEWGKRRFCSRKCKRLTSESKKKCSDSRKGLTVGDNHPMWDPNSKRHSTEIVPCSCGCGETLKKYDTRGRMKRYIDGHALRGKKRIFSEEWKNKIREANRRNKKKGKDHWNWKGGITPANNALRNTVEYKTWRMNVFRHDHFTCVQCGYRSKKGGDIHADHIQPFSTCPILRHELSNGRTLCVPCHKKTESWLGRYQQ